MLGAATETGYVTKRVTIGSLSRAHYSPAVGVDPLPGATGWCAKDLNQGLGTQNSVQ